MKVLEEKIVSKKKPNLPVLDQTVSLIDTHCHLDMDVYEDDLDEVLKRAASHRVNQVITIGIDLASSRNAVRLAMKYPNVFATVGVHPHDVDNSDESAFRSLADLAERHRDRVVGYGEIGLDYVKRYSEIDNQRKQFAGQLRLARELNLPVVIHDREAHDDTLAILKNEGPFEAGGVMHCFSGDSKYAGEVLDLGFYISVPGVVTFKNATELQEVASTIPLDRLLVETDGPFLSPHPLRGKRNEPVNVLYTADYIAALRNMDLNEFAAATTANARNLFKLNNPDLRTPAP